MRMIDVEGADNHWYRDNYTDTYVVRTTKESNPDFKCYVKLWYYR